MVEFPQDRFLFFAQWFELRHCVNRIVYQSTSRLPRRVRRLVRRRLFFDNSRLRNFDSSG